MSKKRVAKSCKDCKGYSDRYCTKFKITISAISNAKLCSKYEPKENVKVTAKRRKRCNTCEYFGVGTTLYRCSKRNKKLTYTALMYCNSYKKKATK